MPLSSKVNSFILVLGMVGSLVFWIFVVVFAVRYFSNPQDKKVSPPVVYFISKVLI